MKELYLEFFSNMDFDNIDKILISKLQGSIFIFNKERTEWYRKNLPREKTFVLEMTNNKYSPLLFFCSYKLPIYKLVNIVFNKNINDDDYDNEFDKIIAIFTKKIRRNKFFKTTIIDSASNINKIITSKICRDKFVFLLKTFPNSYHPFDIRRIDQIIWSIHKYSRKIVNLNDLREYLYKDDNLKKDYIDFLINRIRSGLQLLYINSDKYKY